MFKIRFILLLIFVSFSEVRSKTLYFKFCSYCTNALPFFIANNISDKRTNTISNCKANMLSNFLSH